MTAAVAAVIVVLVVAGGFLARSVGWTCFGPQWMADLSVDVPGEPTQQAAIDAWRGSDPAAWVAPATGWHFDADEYAATASLGTWRVFLVETRSGGWLVSGIMCQW